MSTLTAVMAVKNEEKKIRQCLDNIKDFVDEIVVVDMNSSDRTRDICREYTEKIFTSEGGPLGLIPVNKQYGFEHASSEWIIIVDADFLYNDRCKAEIRSAIKSGGKFSAYKLKFKNLFFGKWPKYGFSLSEQVLLFKKNRGKYECNTAHDALKIDGDIGTIEEPFHHLGHPTIENFLTNMNKYTSQEASIIVKGGTGGYTKMTLKKLSLFNMIWLPIRIFIICYFIKRGYKDGIHGLIIATLFSVYYFVELAKVYELKYKEESQWTLDKEPDW